MFVLSTHRWHQSSRMSWCAYWGANSGSSLSCVRIRWSCCRDSRITLMPFRAPLWATWRGWLTPSRSRSVSLFAGVAWELRSGRLRADQRHVESKESSKLLVAWDIGAVKLPDSSVTISVPLSPFLRARNSEIHQRRTDAFSVLLSCLVTH